jgi:hypothetical protein
MFRSFGPAFYCADEVRAAFRFAILTALYQVTLIDCSGRQSASVIYFDVPEDDQNQFELVGEAWDKFTGQCLQKEYRLAYRGEGRSALELVMGKLVRNREMKQRHPRHLMTIASSGPSERYRRLAIQRPGKNGRGLFCSMSTWRSSKKKKSRPLAEQTNTVPTNIQL